MENLNAYTNISMKFYQIGDFCIAYSSRYFEFFRARILNIDHISKLKKLTIILRKFKYLI